MKTTRHQGDVRYTEAELHALFGRAHAEEASDSATRKPTLLLDGQ